MSDILVPQSSEVRKVLWSLFLREEERPNEGDDLSKDKQAWAFPHMIIKNPLVSTYLSLCKSPLIREGSREEALKDGHSSIEIFRE